MNLAHQYIREPNVSEQVEDEQMVATNGFGEVVTMMEGEAGKHMATNVK